MRRSFVRASASFTVLFLGLLLLACSTRSQQRGGPLPSVAKSPCPALPASKPVAPADPSVEDKVLVSVSKALRRAKLLTRPDQCYAYDFNPEPSQTAYTVDVRENHSHPECGGDPQTQPHLFTVHVDKVTRAFTQDAGSPGNFQPIAP